MAKPGRPEVLVVGIALACAVASVAVACWKKWPDPQAFGTKGEWVGALASFAAALTAIAIALWSHRRNKIESMTEGAFEIVAADYVIRQVKARAELFRLQLTKYAELVAELDSRTSRCEQQMEAVQMDVSPPMDLIIGLESHYKGLVDKKNEESTKAISEFSGHMEYLQSQMATLSHVKMAAFDPAVGLAVVKAKALLQRSEGVVKMAAATTGLPECLNEVLEHLGIFEAAIPAAERHIKRIAEGH
ncbi:MAG: hypothetical protein ACN6PV_02060 [Achromobacter sp.]|uniref:hypothetical protein n=1 Tax=Achromobacter sp. TaxID=134375 RepID=UPI003D06CDDA